MALSANDGIVYAGSYDDKIYALNASTGQKIWSRNLDSADLYASPVVGSNGAVFATTLYGVNNQFFALNGTNNNVLWQIKAPYGVYATPAIGPDGTLYAPTYRRCYAYNPETGASKWYNGSFNNAYNYSSPAVSPDGSVIYFGTDDKKVVAAYTANGTFKWSFGVSEKVFAAIALSADGSMVYAGSWNDNLYALNATDGSQIWSYSLGGNSFAQPLVSAEGILYVGAGDDNGNTDTLHAVNGTNGNRLWVADTGGQVYGTPLLSKENVLYVSSSGTAGIKAYNATNRNVLWTANINGVYGALNMDDSGTLYATAGNSVYAIETESSGPADVPWPMFGLDKRNSSYNFPPTASAGADQNVNEGASVTLNGLNSADSDGSIRSYAWVQTSGTAVALANNATSQATFTAPPVGVGGEALAFRLSVADNRMSPDEDSVTVNVANVNQAPSANAGSAQNVNENSTVTLDGSGSSDPDANISTYAWTQTGGTTVALSGASTQNATFTAPEVAPGGETLTFMLTVTDADNAQASDTTTVTVLNVNQAPVVSAGTSQSVSEGANVTLDGSGTSDPDSNISTYAWTQTGGTGVALSGASSQNATFTAPQVDPQGTTLTFLLTVTDTNGTSASASTTVQVTNVNRNPIADAGSSQNVNEGASVILDGSGSSDPDANIATYAWTQTGGTSVALSGPSSQNATFTAPEVPLSGAALTFKLTVTDTNGTMGTDSTTVNVANVNRAPTADAGADQTVKEGASATLDGTGSSDPDGNISTYAWTQIQGDSVRITNAGSSTATFTAPATNATGQALTFKLSVSDSAGLTSTDTTIVNVSDTNVAPTADAGGDQNATEGETVLLSAVNSTDSDGTISAYSWVQTSGETVTLSAGNEVNATFVAPAVTGDTTLGFKLTVQDSEGLEGSARITVIVKNNQETESVPNGFIPVKVVGSGDGEVGNKSLGLNCSVGVSMTKLESKDPDDVANTTDKPADLPYGLLDFTLKVSTAGDSANVTVALPEPAPSGAKWYKYDTANGWYDYTDNATVSANRSEVVIQLTDGGRGDSDGSANGFIVDPSGLATTASSSSGSSSGCLANPSAGLDMEWTLLPLIPIALLLAGRFRRSRQR